MPGRIFPIRKVRSGPPAHFLGYPGKYFLSCARWHLVFLYIASALCLSSLPCLLLLYHSHRVPGLYVFHGSGYCPVLRSVYHNSILYANICSFHILPLFICADRFNRHIHLSFPPKTRKTPAAARRDLSLWVSMKFYIICVYCFSAFPCYEIFYTHINLRLPELLIQIQSVEAA